MLSLTFRKRNKYKVLAMRKLLDTIQREVRILLSRNTVMHTGHVALLREIKRKLEPLHFLINEWIMRPVKWYIIIVSSITRSNFIRWSSGRLYTPVDHCIMAISSIHDLKSADVKLNFISDAEHSKMFVSNTTFISLVITVSRMRIFRKLLISLLTPLYCFPFWVYCFCSGY